MPLPGDITTITVTGSFTDFTGRPLAGMVTFTPSAQVLDSTGGEVLPPSPLPVPVVNGQISVVLPCTDDPTLNPTGFTYQVNEQVPGGTTYPIALPRSLGASADLSSLAQVPAVTPTQEYLPLPSGTPTAGQVPVATGAGEASAWGNPPDNDAGFLQAANNLSDVDSVSTARTNLGLGTAATQATSAFDAAGTSAAETTRAEAAEALALQKSGGTMTGALTDAVSALTDAASVAVNAALGNVFTLLTTSAVGASRQLANPTNPVTGQFITVAVTQAATGGPYTLTYGGAYSFPLGSAPTLSTGASVTDYLDFWYNGTSWVLVGFTPGATPAPLALASGGTGASSAAGAWTNLASSTTGIQTKAADTGASGYTLVNATNTTIISWTAPSDGNMHTVSLYTLLVVTSGETGGQVNVQYTDMGGTSQNYVLFNAALATGSQTANNAEIRNRILVPAGGTVTLIQVSALTAGAAKLYAQIWAS